MSFLVYLVIGVMVAFYAYNKLECFKVEGDTNKTNTGYDDYYEEDVDESMMIIVLGFIACCWPVFVTGYAAYELYKVFVRKSKS